MAKRNNVFQGYSLEPQTVKLIDYVSKITMVPKSRLVNKAILEAYSGFLKDMEKESETEQE